VAPTLMPLVDSLLQVSQSNLALAEW